MLHDTITKANDVLFDLFVLVSDVLCLALLFHIQSTSIEIHRKFTNKLNVLFRDLTIFLTWYLYCPAGEREKEEEQYLLSTEAFFSLFLSFIAM